LEHDTKSSLVSPGCAIDEAWWTQDRTVPATEPSVRIGFWSSGWRTGSGRRDATGAYPRSMPPAPIKRTTSIVGNDESGRPVVVSLAWSSLTAPVVDWTFYAQRLSSWSFARRLLVEASLSRERLDAGAVHVSRDGNTEHTVFTVKPGRSFDVVREALWVPSDQLDKFLLGRIFCQAPEIDGAVVIQPSTPVNGGIIPGTMVRGNIIARAGFDLEVLIEI